MLDFLWYFEIFHMLQLYCSKNIQNLLLKVKLHKVFCAHFYEMKYKISVEERGKIYKDNIQEQTLI